MQAKLRRFIRDFPGWQLHIQFISGRIMDLCMNFGKSQTDLVAEAILSSTPNQPDTQRQIKR
jgi:hypothetical protein